MNRNITELIERLNSIPFSLLDVFKEKFVEMLEKENISNTSRVVVIAVQ